MFYFKPRWWSVPTHASSSNINKCCVFSRTTCFPVFQTRFYLNLSRFQRQTGGATFLFLSVRLRPGLSVCELMRNVVRTRELLIYIFFNTGKKDWLDQEKYFQPFAFSLPTSTVHYPALGLLPCPSFLPGHYYSSVMFRLIIQTCFSFPIRSMSLMQNVHIARFSTLSLKLA